MRSLAIVLFSLGLPAAAWAQNVVVGVEVVHYYPLFEYKDGEYIGAAGEILNAFAKAKGYSFVYRAEPINRLFQSLMTGKIDLKFPDNPDWQSEVKKGATVVYSDPVLSYVDGSSVPADRRTIDISQVRSIVTYLGFTPVGYLDAIRQNKVKLWENSSFEALIDQVLNGHADAAYANVAVMTYHLKQMGKDGALAFAPNLPSERSAYRLSSTQHPELIGAFNGWMKSNQPLLAAIRAKYGTDIVQ